MQWMAMGEGQVDWPSCVRRFSELCPSCPFVLEIICGAPREFPFQGEEFWQQWPGMRASDLARFLALAKRRKTLPAPVDPDDPTVQKSALERSLRYCRETLGLGLRA